MKSGVKAKLGVRRFLGRLFFETTGGVSGLLKRGENDACEGPFRGR